MSEFILICHWIKIIFLGKVNLLCLFELKIDFLMSGIYFYLSRKKYDFPRKRRHILPFFLLNQTKKATYIRGRLHQTKECIMHYRWSRGGMPKGQQRILIKKGPHFWALALAFVVQLATSLSAPLEGGRGAHGRRAARREGG